MKTTTRQALICFVCIALALGLTTVQPSIMTHPSAPLAEPLPEAAIPLAATSSGNSMAQITPVLGVVRVLVVAVAFQGSNPSISVGELKREWLGTVASYYHEASFGKLTIQADVYGWYTLPHSESYYGRDCHAINDADCSGTNQSWKIANDTVPLAVKDVNFSNYDYYVFLHDGTGQETSLNPDDIWSVTYLNMSVKTPTKTLTRFNIVPELEAPPNVPNGVWCVEFAHNLGVPDLYDTTDGPNNGKPILGPWELMDKGSWNGDPPGSLPAHMSAWAKIHLGWISGPLLYTAPLGTSRVMLDPTEIASDQVHAIKIIIGTNQNSSQYYLVEARKQIGFDAALPAAGVLITFVNESRSVGIVRVINSDPEVADLEDAVWHIDQTFADKQHNLSVMVVGKIGNSYEITVYVGEDTPAQTNLSTMNSTAHIVISGVPLTVLIVTTLPAQERGLSGLPSLPSNEGMLFVFDHEDYWAFWMINMKFPLDIIWFNSAREVVWTEKDLQPCPVYNCPSIMPDAKSMYVLEVNAGFVAAHDITLGSTFSFVDA